MFASLNQLMKHSHGSMPAKAATPPAVPLRKNTLAFNNIKVGHAVIFAESCPLPQLRTRKCAVTHIKHYRFGTESMESFQLSVDSGEQFYLSVAVDADGHYLAISRQLSESEQNIWFGRDALGFFTEQSTAKTIRSKVDRVIEGAWAAERYMKSVDWVEGKLLGEGRGESAFHYNLLVNETGEKALEIEHYDASGTNQVYVTVYRPVEDILTIAESIPHIPAPPAIRKPAPVAPVPSFVPIASEPAAAEMPPTRPDFRRVSEEPTIHIPATSPLAMDVQQPEPPLPSFLMAREPQAYLSLDEVIPPEAERVRCGILAAKHLIDAALDRGVRVRDVLRELVGLESSLSEEVIFEMPLSEKDYRMLAQRYKLRPDARDEIRVRLQDELRKKLLS